MTPQEAQALIEGVRQTLKDGKDLLASEEALDQLSVHLAEQEKAVRVKVLEELKSGVKEMIVDTGSQITINLVLEKVIDQKLKEAKG